MTGPGALIREQLADFVVDEAGLLYEQRWEAWNALFAYVGWFWLPAWLAPRTRLHDALPPIHLPSFRVSPSHSQHPATWAALHAGGGAAPHTSRRMHLATGVRGGKACTR